MTVVSTLADMDLTRDREKKNILLKVIVLQTLADMDPLQEMEK